MFGVAGTSCPASAVQSTDDLSSYIDTDPYSFFSSLNVLLVMYSYDIGSSQELGTGPEDFPTFSPQNFKTTNIKLQTSNCDGLPKYPD